MGRGRGISRDYVSRSSVSFYPATLSLFRHLVRPTRFSASVPPRFIFRGCGAIWLEVTDRRPVAFTNLPLPTPRHPRTTIAGLLPFSRSRSSRGTPSTRISEHSVLRVDSIAPSVLMNLERSPDLEHTVRFSRARAVFVSSPPVLVRNSHFYTQPICHIFSPVISRYEY